MNLIGGGTSWVGTPPWCRRSQNPDRGGGGTAGGHRDQPRAPPETVIREPAWVLPLAPVIRLTGSGSSSLRLGWKAGIAAIGPGRVGLRRRAEAPSVPVTCLPRFQSSPLIERPEDWPAPVTREVWRPEGSTFATAAAAAAGAAAGAGAAASEAAPPRAAPAARALRGAEGPRRSKRNCSVPVTLSLAMSKGPVMRPPNS